MNELKKSLIPKLLFVYFITTIFAVALSFSSYKTTLAGTSGSKVAVPVINLSSDTLGISISSEIKEKSYLFDVENSKDGQKSEVSMQYILEIQTLGNLPLEFELYEVSDSQETTNLLNNSNVTDVIVMDLNEDTHSYKLKIKWKENETSYLYSRTIDYVKVVLDSSQVD